MCPPAVFFLGQLAATKRLRASENTAPKSQHSKNVQSEHKIFHLVFGVNTNSILFSFSLKDPIHDGSFVSRNRTSQSVSSSYLGTVFRNHRETI